MLASALFVNSTPGGWGSCAAQAWSDRAAARPTPPRRRSSGRKSWSWPRGPGCSWRAASGCGPWRCGTCGRRGRCSWARGGQWARHFRSAGYSPIWGRFGAVPKSCSGSRHTWIWPPGGVVVGVVGVVGVGAPRWRWAASSTGSCWTLSAGVVAWSGRGEWARRVLWSWSLWSRTCGWGWRARAAVRIGRAAAAAAAAASRRALSGRLSSRGSRSSARGRRWSRTGRSRFWAPPSICGLWRIIGCWFERGLSLSFSLSLSLYASVGVLFFGQMFSWGVGAPLCGWVLFAWFYGYSWVLS